MTARFRLEGPYGFDGTENPRLHGETRAAHTARDYDYCSHCCAYRDGVSARLPRMFRPCLPPRAALSRAGVSCRVGNRNPRLLGFLEQGAAIDFAYDELQRMRRARARS